MKRAFCHAEEKVLSPDNLCIENHISICLSGNFSTPPQLIIISTQVMCSFYTYTINDGDEHHTGCSPCQKPECPIWQQALADAAKQEQEDAARR